MAESSDRVTATLANKHRRHSTQWRERMRTHQTIYHSAHLSFCLSVSVPLSLSLSLFLSVSIFFSLLPLPSLFHHLPLFVWYSIVFIHHPSVCVHAGCRNVCLPLRCTRAGCKVQRHSHILSYVDAIGQTAVNTYGFSPLPSPSLSIFFSSKFSMLYPQR